MTIWSVWQCEKLFLDHVFILPNLCYLNLELARTDPDEIKENVPMMTDVHRIVVKRNNVEIKTNTLILTFNSPQIPDSKKKMLSEYSRYPVCT